MNTILKHTLPFIPSILLTLLPLFLTLYTNITFHPNLTIIFPFPFIQPPLQLLIFIHLTQAKHPPLQSFKLIFPIIITLLTLIPTYWVMQGGHSS
ncbi:cytochrome C oxidase subunit IV family protein, partial [Staphylococcus epidermidis]|uniref:cytochrome aa3 quinol oxidase subunit IV n=1 Tax=Staphylococcus epidermidis TaxID=1282 RepID=UPI0011A1C749